MAKATRKQIRIIKSVVETRIHTSRDGVKSIDFMAPLINSEEGGHNCPTCQCSNYIGYTGYSLPYTDELKDLSTGKLIAYALKYPSKVFKG